MQLRLGEKWPQYGEIHRRRLVCTFSAQVPDVAASGRLKYQISDPSDDHIQSRVIRAGPIADEVIAVRLRLMAKTPRIDLAPGPKT
jgi:hypothetical protein